MTIRTYVHLPINSLFQYWTEMDRGSKPLAWNVPPMIYLSGVGTYDVRSLFLMTSANRGYHLTSYSEFWRLVIRNNYLQLMFESGPDEIILGAYGTFIPPIELVDPTSTDNVIKLFPDKGQ